MLTKYKIIIGILIVIAVGSLAGNVVLVNKLEAAKKSVATPGTPSAEEVKKVVSEVGRYISLPDDETPSMATVADPSALKDQPFFAKAEAGDIVLIYATSRKAILWRPSNSKIIEVSAINLPPPTETPSPSPSLTPNSSTTSATSSSAQ